MASEAVDVYAAGTAVAGAMCWICQTRIMAGDEIVFCPHDKLPSHAECWEQNNGCPVYGCEAAPERGQVSVQALGVQTGEANYHCPGCHKTVKPNFLTCTFCGAPIAVASVVLNVEYDDYRFRQKENQRVKPAVWCLLAMAATGVLAPLVLVLAVFIKLRGALGKLRFSHMLRDSRSLYYAALGLSALQTILLVVIMVMDA